MRCRRVQRAARIDAGVARAGRVSPRRGRVRAVVAQLVVRSVGVSPRAPGGGGEPRAVRAAARCRSVSPRRAAPAARRRAISLHAPAARAPRLRPVFLWTRQRRDGLVQAVHCEDYDARNRLRVARTAAGWRVIPRTAVFDAIAVPPRPRRRPRRARPAPPPPEPTPLDSLLAVAELELREQAMSLEARADAAHAALFESLSEAHYLPALPAAPHDDALLESLVEKGCEDNHVLGQALDKLAALAARGAGAGVGAGAGGGGGERQLASPRRSMSAAQGLLHLHELPYSAPHYAPHLHDLHSDLPADLHADLPADLHADLHAELSGPGDLHEHLDSSRDLHGDLHDHLSMAGDLHDALSVPDDLHGDLSMPGDLQSDLSVPGDLSSELHGDLSMTGDLPSDISSAIANGLPQPKSEDISSEIPCELLSEMTNEMPCEMISEMTCEIPSEISCEISREMPCEISSAMIEEPPRQMTPNTNVLTEINKSAIDTCTEPIQGELKTEDNCEPDPAEEELAPKLETLDALADLDYLERMDDSPGGVELVPTDLRVNKNVEKKSRHRLKETATAKKPSEDNFLARNCEQPRDLSVPRRPGTPASPRRPASRESDAAQSPQPSGIPAVPPSPELCAATCTKTKQTLFLESLLSSPSPKMYTSEVTITKQQCEPLNLGKHRKSASPTVTSCSDEMKTLDKDFAEPQEKKVKRESTEDLTKLNKEFDKSSEDYVELIPKKTEPITSKLPSDATPLQQLQFLKTNPEFNIPDPLLIPKDRLNLIISAPAVEIPALLSQRPELRIPQALAFPSVLQDPNNIIISLSQIEQFVENASKKVGAEKSNENKTTASKSPATSTEKDKCNKAQSDSTSQPKPIPSMDALAGDIDAATSAALNQMLWLPYLSQIEAMATCSQNMDFLKALHSSGYPPPNYSDMSQMFPSSRLMNPAGFPMMSQMDYDNRMQLAMWQEQMNHANNAASQRPRPASIDAQIKEMSKSTDVQNPYVHSTKNHQGKTHSAARTSPIAHNYNNQRSMNHNPYMQGMQSMYPGMNPTIRPNVPLPGLQIPYFNPNMGSQRSPRTAQQKSPTSPYFPNNNYLQSLKQQAEAPGQQQRSGSVGSQESPRPRISVKSLQNLLEPTAAAASGVGPGLRRAPAPGAPGRRREDAEVGSTTPGEAPHLALPHPHDPASFHLWHPLFGNHKSYNSPWSWTTVTATGD